MSPLKTAIQQPETTDRLNILIYGMTGVGKTHLLGTANDCEEMYPMLLVDTEGGTKTLAGKKIDVARPKDWAEIQDIYDFMRYENKKYRSIGLDSLTEVQRKLSMGSILGELDKDGYKNLGATIVPQRQDWMRTGDQMRKLIRAFRDLAYLTEEKRRVHVVFTALERSAEDRNVFPQLSGQLGQEVGAFVDVLGRLAVTDMDVPTEESDEEAKAEGDQETPGTRQMRYLLVDTVTGKDGRHYAAKNRGGRLGQIVWEPTLDKLVQAWRTDE
jgi:hypothetical protein